MRKLTLSIATLIVSLVVTVLTAIGAHGATCITNDEIRQVQIDMRKSWIHTHLFDGYSGYHSETWTIFPHQFDKRMYDICNDGMNFRITYVKSATTDPSVWRVNSFGRQG